MKWKFGYGDHVRHNDGREGFVVTHDQNCWKTGRHLYEVIFGGTDYVRGVPEDALTLIKKWGS